MELVELMSRSTKRLPQSRPSEWATWQGRLVWAIDRAVRSYTSVGEASVSWGFARTQLNTWRKRLGDGGDVNFSTLLQLQEHMHISWSWLATGDGWPTQEVARLHGGHLRSVPDDTDDED